MKQPRSPSQDVTSPERNQQNRFQAQQQKDCMEGKRACSHHHKHHHHHHGKSSKSCEKPASTVQNLVSGVRDWLKQHLPSAPATTTPSTPATEPVRATPTPTPRAVPIG